GRGPRGRRRARARTRPLVLLALVLGRLPGRRARRRRARRPGRRARGVRLKRGVATLAAPHFTGSEKWACGPIFCDRDGIDADDTREGTPAAGGDRPAGPAGPAGGGAP